MKYRIKKISYPNGMQLFYVQFRITWFWWDNLSDRSFKTYEDAIERIERAKEYDRAIVTYIYP